MEAIAKAEAAASVGIPANEPLVEDSIAGPSTFAPALSSSTIGPPTTTIYPSLTEPPSSTPASNETPAKSQKQPRKRKRDYENGNVDVVAAVNQTQTQNGAAVEDGNQVEAGLGIGKGSSEEEAKAGSGSAGPSTLNEATMNDVNMDSAIGSSSSYGVSDAGQEKPDRQSDVKNGGNQEGQGDAEIGDILGDEEPEEKVAVVDLELVKTRIVSILCLNPRIPIFRMENLS